MNIPDIGDNLTLFTALIASIVPAVLAVINRRSWSSEQKGIAAIIVSILAGSGTAWVSGNWDGADITRSVLIVFFLSQIAYQTFWKPTSLGSSIEEAT